MPLSPMHFCLNCGDEFEPIEGNEGYAFCGTECEDYWLKWSPYYENDNEED